MFSAETAILLHLESFGIVLLVLDCVVISLLALTACQSDFYSHFGAPPIINSCFCQIALSYEKFIINFCTQKKDLFISTHYYTITYFKSQVNFAKMLKIVAAKCKKHFTATIFYISTTNKRYISGIVITDKVLDIIVMEAPVSVSPP